LAWAVLIIDVVLIVVVVIVAEDGDETRVSLLAMGAGESTSKVELAGRERAASRCDSIRHCLASQSSVVFVVAGIETVSDAGGEVCSAAGCEDVERTSFHDRT
jgi:putative Ca2+/H+ antiporter (TMEM165/GDT1 family)